MIENFKKIYGEEIYTERNKQYKGLKVKLKNGIVEGVIDSLWLPKNKKKNRNQDLFLVKWNNGKEGVVELKDLEYELSTL